MNELVGGVLTFTLSEWAIKVSKQRDSRVSVTMHSVCACLCVRFRRADHDVVGCPSAVEVPLNKSQLCSLNTVGTKA